MHHLQPFHPDYFTTISNTQAEKLFSYSTENCEAARALISEPRKTCPVFSAPLPTPPAELKQVEIRELVRFFSHPARYLLLKIVGIAPIEEIGTLETSEPFILEGLARYNLEHDILNHLLRNQDCSRLYTIKKAAGELPHGRIGETYFTQLVSELQSFHKRLSALIPGQELRQQQVNLAIGDYTLTGLLDNVGANGLVQYRYAIMKPKDVIRSWISHLVLNSSEDHPAAENSVNTFYAAKEGIYKYAPAAESTPLLKQLLDLYWQGLAEPLCFFPRASFSFAQEIHKSGKEQEALRKAINEWEGNGYTKKGEKNDPYNLLCCENMELSSPLFMEQAKKVFLPALAHQEKIA
jgi:exodeoxyribonuclease V gamma subunit